LVTPQANEKFIISNTIIMRIKRYFFLFIIISILSFCYFFPLGTLNQIPKLLYFFP
jgi:hypothetical protein